MVSNSRDFATSIVAAATNSDGKVNAEMLFKMLGPKFAKHCEQVNERDAEEERDLLLKQTNSIRLLIEDQKRFMDQLDRDMCDEDVEYLLERRARLARVHKRQRRELRKKHQLIDDSDGSFSEEEACRDF